METITEYLPLAIVALVLLVGGAIAIRVGTPKLARWWELRKTSELEREAFLLKQRLLEHPAIVEFFAPVAEFQRKTEEGKKPGTPLPWLSPFPSAVKAANARLKRARKQGLFTNTRAQIANAAALISVETLPVELQPGNPGAEHFSIKLALDGKTEGKVLSLAETIKSQLGLHSLEPMASDDFLSVKFAAHAVLPLDKLRLLTPGTDWFTENQAERVTSIPLAVKEDGSSWSLPTHHTLIHGTTGSGKSSPIQGIVRQLEPFVRDGIVKLYGIDPKNAELKPYRNTSLFSALALGDVTSMAAQVNACWELMKHRQDTIVETIDNDFGRSVPFDKETPLVLIIIDELLSLLSALKQEGKVGAKTMQKLVEILAQGRSANIFVIAATQAATKELMCDMRDNFNNKIVLRLEDGMTYWNDLWLGEGAALRGNDATKILPSTKDNGYATAGIGYVKEETGNPVKVRFGRTNAQDLAGLIERNPRQSDFGLESFPPLSAPLIFGVTGSGRNSPRHDEEETDWTFEELPADETDPDALPAL